MRLKMLLLGIGAAILFLLPYCYSSLIYDHLNDIYHRFLPNTGVAGGILINLLVLCAVCVGIVFLLARYLPNTQHPLYGLIAAVCLWRGINDVILLLLQQEILPSSFNECFLQWRKPTLGALAVLFLSAWKIYPKLSKQVLRVAIYSTLLWSGCIFWIVPSLLHSATANQPSDAGLLKKASASPSAKPQERVIWILLDELSYDQAFEHRQKSVLLPNLDRLQSESITYTQLSPVANFTDIIIPSVLIGRPLSKIKSDTQGKLFLYPDDTKRWERFDETKTVFATARENGWTTGIAGWHNPYCRILPNTLDTCTWIPEAADAPVKGDQPSLKSALDLFSHTAAHLGQRQAQDDELYEAHRRTTDFVLPEAVTLVRDEKIRFAFVHLPLPHPPGIYNRQTHQIQSGGSYLDNLVFADDLLGVLLKEIDKTASAEHTTIIVSSDHSWRVPLWRDSPIWTKEDEQVSQGRFDPRPVLLIHSPGATSSRSVDQPTSELVLTEILRGLLRHRTALQAGQ